MITPVILYGFIVYTGPPSGPDGVFFYTSA
jgi:hypothetical protein